MARSDAVIYIPTYKRTQQYLQKTYYYMPEPFKEITYLVCPPEEIPKHQEYFPNAKFIEQPSDVKTIAQKRAWLIRQCEKPKFLMIDDDMRFCIRVADPALRTKEDPKYLHVQEDINDPRLINFLHEFFDKLDEYAHATITPRQNSHTVPYEVKWKELGRAVYALGFQTEVIRNKCELGRILTREDYDYTLQLLKQGYKNVIGCDVALNTAAYVGKGGTEDERTLDRANQDALKLQELHPGLVKLVNREYKTGTPDRLEPVIQWQKAYEQSKKPQGFF